MHVRALVTGILAIGFHQTIGTTRRQRRSREHAEAPQSEPVQTTQASMHRSKLESRAETLDTGRLQHISGDSQQTAEVGCWSSASSCVLTGARVLNRKSTRL